MSDLWARFVRWLAGEHIKYLEYENRALRAECDRWVGRYEGAMNAVKVFEARHNYLMQTVADSQVLKPTEPIIVRKP